MINIKKRSTRALFAFAILLLVCGLAFVNATIWSLDIQLTTNLGTDWNPSVTQTSDGKIWVVWASNRYGGNFDIFHKTSSDGGATWSGETQLTTDPGTDDSPSITQTMDGKIWVVWHSSRTGNYTIFYKTSSDGGASWTNDTQLSTDMGYNMNPSIVNTFDGKILVVWQSDRMWVWDPVAGENIPQDDLFYVTSSNGGATWSAETQLTTDTEDDILPSVTQTSDGKIWVVWASNRYGGNFDIFHKTSSDGGATWSAETQLTTHISGDWRPSITQSSDMKIWVVWHSQRDSNYDLFYVTSSNGGTTWSNETQLTTNLDVDAVPSIKQNIQGVNGTMWVVWASNRTGNYDLFYKTSDVGVFHDVAITSVTPFSTQAYTTWGAAGGSSINPITVTVKNFGTTTEPFSVSARYTNTSGTAVIQTKAVTLAAGQAKTLTFNWAVGVGSSMAVGTYTIFANASTVVGETNTANNQLTDGTVKIYYGADANGDGFVGGYDATLVSINWWSNVPPADQKADFNGDGFVGGYDATIVSINWWTNVPKP